MREQAARQLGEGRERRCGQEHGLGVAAAADAGEGAGQYDGGREFGGDSGADEQAAGRPPGLSDGLVPAGREEVDDVGADESGSSDDKKRAYRRRYAAHGLRRRSHMRT